MKLLDRLVIKAKQQVNNNSEKLHLVFIHFEDEMYIADCRLWNGKKGSGTRSIILKADTIEALLLVIEELSEQYPSNTDIPIICEFDLED